jgi:hypothetical protein
LYDETLEGPPEHPNRVRYSYLPLKAPKEVETHYAREERIPEVPYRPVIRVDETGRMARESRRNYTPSERKESTEELAREHEVESNSLGTETEFDSVISGLMSRMDEMKLVPTVESAESALQDPTDIEIDAALKAPELSEPNEYPAKDLELLMTEIDAILLQPETKTDQVENAERPL